MWSTAGMATDRGTSTCALEQVSSLRSDGHMMKDRTYSKKKVENLTKMAEQETRYQVFLVLGKGSYMSKHCRLTQRCPELATDNRLARFIR